VRNCRLFDYSPTQRAAPIKKSPAARIVVPGMAQKLNRVKSDGSPAKITDPAISAMMERSVLNASKSSTVSTKITLQERDYVVGKTITLAVSDCPSRVAISNQQSKICNSLGVLAQLVERLNGIDSRPNDPKVSRSILKALTFDTACRRVRNSVLKLSHRLSKNLVGG
jgi:hypothetical protein